MYPDYVSINYLLLSFAWSISEIVRYPFYILNSLAKLINKDNLIPYFLLWARYSFFIVLYPIGVSGEILTILFSRPELVKYSTKYININYVIYGIICLYIPGLTMLYTHLLKQRKKALNPKVQKIEKKTQ
jgi:very-long-chain (3R)-3-hydroxyacyl-CoA dehydratase